jgi:hypothetical protein
MGQIHDAIERDLHRHIMMDRSSSELSPTIEIVEPDIPFLYSEGLIMEEVNDIRLENNVMFSRDTIRESLFWLKRLVSERYYAKQKRLLLTDIRNHNKPNLDTVIWWNHLNDNYTKRLKITKWSVPYITKEMWPDMEDDEIEYANVMWNCIFGDKPYTSDFNNIKPKNPWLEKKNKRGK